MTCSCPAHTQALGRRIGALVVQKLVIGLIGALGAGKTAFVHGVARGLGVNDPYITSPTFSLINAYQGRLPFWHADLYRLSGPSDVQDIGLEEMLGADRGVVAVEWADKMDWAGWPDRLEIRLTIVDENTRALELTGFGADAQAIIEKIAKSGDSFP